jgi:hypothetical protein
MHFLLSPRVVLLLLPLAVVAAVAAVAAVVPHLLLFLFQRLPST